jgi:hypothetical protein
LAAQGAQWVVLRVQTLAGVAGLVAARIAQIASSVATVIATAVTWAYNAALLANPLTWIVLAVVALIAVVILLWKNWASVTGWLTGAWQAIKGAAVAVFGWLAGFFRQWGLVILAVILGPIGLIGLAIYKNWDRIRGFLGSAWEAIRGAAVGAFTGLVGFFRTWGLTILAVITGPVGWIALAIVKNWDRIKGVLTGGWGWM